jgi:hypothetical protein
MERRRKRSSVGSEKMERIGNKIGKNGEVLFDRPKPTASCSANGRRIHICQYILPGRVGATCYFTENL